MEYFLRSGNSYHSWDSALLFDRLVSFRWPLHIFLKILGFICSLVPNSLCGFWGTKLKCTWSTYWSNHRHFVFSKFLVFYYRYFLSSFFSFPLSFSHFNHTRLHLSRYVWDKCREKRRKVWKPSCPLTTSQSTCLLRQVLLCFLMYEKHISKWKIAERG